MNTLSFSSLCLYVRGISRLMSLWKQACNELKKKLWITKCDIDNESAPLMRSLQRAPPLVTKRGRTRPRPLAKISLTSWLSKSFLGGGTSICLNRTNGTDRIVITTTDHLHCDRNGQTRAKKLSSQSSCAALTTAITVDQLIHLKKPGHFNAGSPKAWAVFY